MYIMYDEDTKKDFLYKSISSSSISSTLPTNYDGQTKERMITLRTLIHSWHPDIMEKNAWGIPTFVLKGNLVHFSAEKKHMGFNPGKAAIDSFSDRFGKLADFSKGELALWASSSVLILASFLIFDRENFITLAASLIGTTSLIFNAKGNPIGQALMILFSLLYGLISYTFSRNWKRDREPIPGDDYKGCFALILQIIWVIVPMGQKLHQILGLNTVFTTRPMMVEIRIRL